MHLDAAKTPEFSDSYATFWGDAWHVHMNMERVTAVQFVEAEDHGFVPFLYYVRFSDAEEQTVMRLYFPNPYLDDDEQVTDFQPERLQAFETMRDRYVGSEGVTYVQRPRQTG